MKPILYIVAILTIGGAAFLSYKNDVNFKGEQTLRLDTIDKDVQTTAKAVKTEGQLSDEQVKLRNARDQREEANQSIANLKSEESGMKSDLAELETTLAAQNAEKKALEKTLEEIKLVLKELGDDVSLDNFVEKIAEIKETKKNLERELEDKETLVAAANARLVKNNQESERLITNKMKRNERISRNAMESVITAVSPDWGFVVIGAGTSSDFTPQTALLVKRDGKLIGRVRPTKIEQAQTVADVIPESLAPGVRLQPGDRVILAKPVSN